MQITINYSQKVRAYRPEISKRANRQPKLIIKQRGGLLNAKFRNQFLRCFQSWYRENQSQFLLPLYLCKRTDKDIFLVVGDIPARTMNFCIGQGNAYDGGALRFYLNGECIDDICWMEAYTKKTHEGYICSECHSYGEDLRVFPTREALWIDHVFVPLLREVNEKIAPAEHIEFHEDSGCSYVKFVREGETTTLDDESTPVVAVIPIRRPTPLSHFFSTDDDSLFDKAIHALCKQSAMTRGGKEVHGPVSLLQRQFRLPYSRALRIVTALKHNDVLIPLPDPPRQHAYLFDKTKIGRAKWFYLQMQKLH